MSEDLLSLVPSWRISLVAANRAEGTIDLYTLAVRKYAEWAGGRGLDRKLAQEWVAVLLEGGMSPVTARMRVVALRSFSRWLAQEGETSGNILSGLSLPKVPTTVVPSLSEEQIATLLRACKTEGGFIGKRDEAIMRFLFETGTRAKELLNLKVTDVSLDTNTAHIVRGKGGKGRIVPFWPRTGESLDRYLRIRSKLVQPGESRLWITSRGKPLAYHGLLSSLKRRAERVGVNDFHPHRARHTAATRWLRHGGTEGGLMAVAGWSTRSMIDRYTAYSASERAIEESRKLGLGLE